jgi:hypothetical protein
MHIETKGTARIKDQVSGTIYEIEADELDWHAAGGSERQMGSEIEYMAEISHPDLGELTWHLWEYPLGAENYQDQRLNGHELVENFEISLVPDPENHEDNNTDDDAGPTAPNHYYSDEDTIGVAANDLRRMRTADQVPYLTHWFLTYYEDPARSTPYNSAEGGYLYVHGGPYDAQEQISKEFDGIVSERVIEQAIETVQEDGIFDWAPHPNHPSRRDEGMDFDDSEFDRAGEFEQRIKNAFRKLEAGQQPIYGSPVELELRTRIKGAFDQLEAELPMEQPLHGSIGHNKPPQDHRFTDDELTEVRAAIATVRTEIVQDEPNAGLIAKAAGALFRIAKHAARLSGMAAEEFAKAFGRSLGEAAGKATIGVMKWGLVGYVINAILPIEPWLDSVLRLF